ncbi:MAG TPA: hypothetical protein V6C52_00840 [Coleofasciculaceae cyanobacterium]|jgi:hypothetical protein
MPHKPLYTALMALSLILAPGAFADPVDDQPAAALPPQAAPAPAVPLTGTVQTMQMPQPAAPQMAMTAADYLDVQLQPGNSKHRLQEFTVRLQNKQPKHIEVLQMEVLNGMTEQAYLQFQQQKSQAKARVAGGMLRGLTGVATSFIPYAGIGSMAAYHAIGAGTNAAYAMANVVENTGGQVDYSGRIVQRIGNLMISPNQQFQCLAVVPEHQQPQVKVIFKDLQTNQIFELQK